MSQQMRTLPYLRQDIKQAYWDAIKPLNNAPDPEAITGLPISFDVETNAGLQRLSWKFNVVNSFAEACELLPDECWDCRTLSRQGAFRAISAERDYQDAKWGINKPQSLPGFLVVLRQELEEAERGWAKNLNDRSSALAEITQIAAVAVACLEKYGSTGSAVATNDNPERHQ